MNACRAATRPTSKANSSDAERDREPAQRGDAEDHGERAGHEQDDQVPGEDVGEQTIVSESMRIRFESTSRKKMSDGHPAGRRRRARGP